VRAGQTKRMESEVEREAPALAPLRATAPVGLLFHRKWVFFKGEEVQIECHKGGIGLM